jgi:hypothetical protein
MLGSWTIRLESLALYIWNYFYNMTTKLSALPNIERVRPSRPFDPAESSLISDLAYRHASVAVPSCDSCTWPGEPHSSRGSCRPVDSSSWSVRTESGPDDLAGIVARVILYPTLNTDSAKCRGPTVMSSRSRITTTPIRVHRVSA